VLYKHEDSGTPNI